MLKIKDILNFKLNNKILELEKFQLVREKYDYIIISNISSLINSYFINIYLNYLKRKLFQEGHILIMANNNDLKMINIKKSFIFSLNKSYEDICEIKNIKYYSIKDNESTIIDIPFKYNEYEELLYKKYSVERNDNYKISTSIIKKDGDVYVVKEAATKEALFHIQKMKRYEEILNDQYKNTILRINKSILKNDTIIFEYVDGKTLENILDEYYKKNNLLKIKEIAENYVYVLKNDIEKNNKFYVTENFKEIFGDIKFNKKYYAAEVNNIDLIFSNIIINNKKWNVIDYEWVFEFPVPIDFIVFRNFYLYAYNKNDSNLHNMLLHEILGINEDEEKIFEKMEHNFQLYIRKNI